MTASERNAACRVNSAIFAMPPSDCSDLLQWPAPMHTKLAFLVVMAAACHSLKQAEPKLSSPHPSFRPSHCTRLLPLTWSAGWVACPFYQYGSAPQPSCIISCSPDATHLRTLHLQAIPN